MCPCMSAGHQLSAASLDWLTSAEVRSDASAAGWGSRVQPGGQKGEVSEPSERK